MRVLLVSSNLAKSPYPVYPLGMSMIAAAARRDGHLIEFFDFLQHRMSLTALREHLNRFQPHAVGISIRNIDNVNLVNEERYLEAVGRIVACVHNVSPAKTILGGSAFSIFPELIMAQTGAHYGVIGEGEAQFRQLLAAGERGQWPRPGTILSGDTRMAGSDIPTAAYDHKILTSYLQQGSVASLQSKRGCPLDCVYCSYPVLEGRRLRLRPAGQVVDDIEMLSREHRAESVFFADSVFNDDQGAYLEVVKEMQTRRLRIPWSAFFKPTGITAEIVELLKSTGLRSVEMGSDAATDQALKGQRKGFSWADVLAANQLFMDAGIPTAHYFMFGGPDETMATVQAGIDNLLALRCTAAFVFMGVRILPHTELHRIALSQGMVTPQNDLFEPAYYISPAIHRDWLEHTLHQAFADSRRIMFPPDRFDRHLQTLHKMGYTGALWEMLGPESRRKRP